MANATHVILKLLKDKEEDRILRKKEVLGGWENAYNKARIGARAEFSEETIEAET